MRAKAVGPTSQDHGGNQGENEGDIKGPEEHTRLQGGRYRRGLRVELEEPSYLASSGKGRVETGGGEAESRGCQVLVYFCLFCFESV